MNKDRKSNLLDEKVKKTFSLEEIIEASYNGQKGCADLLIKLFKYKRCFDHAVQRWYRFNRHFWQEDLVGEQIKIVDYVQNLFRRVGANTMKKVDIVSKEIGQTQNKIEKQKLKQKAVNLKLAEKNIKGIVKKLNSLQFRKQVVEFSALGQNSLGITGNEWDKKPWELSCQNGVINLKNGNFRPGCPEEYIKSPCTTEYNPTAKCPMFLKFLSEVFDNDIELIEFVKRVFGMGLIGITEQKQYIIILTGVGRNGKDTLLSAIGHVLGGSLSGTIVPEMLLNNGKFGQRNPSAPSPDKMRLRGRRIVWASEIGQGRRFDVGFAKYISGCTKIVGRPPYGRRDIEFDASHLIFVLTNDLPHAPADEYAFWQRIKTLPFQISFVDNPQKPNERLADKKILLKLQTEAQGILRWMVEGCVEFQQIGLKPPHSVSAATEKYRRTNDYMKNFIDEKCYRDISVRCSATELFEVYKKWAVDKNMEILSQTAFGQQMSERGYKKLKSGGLIAYVGIGLCGNKGQDLN